MTVFEFRCSLHVPRPVDEVFPFFTDVHNLEAITPPWLKFHVLTPQPNPMRAGVTIDYRLKVHGLPLRWRSRINVWEPPFRFVDEQVRGPYRLWIHEHRFEEVDGGTLCHDHVRYAVPGGRLLNWLFVRGDVEKIFSHRQRQLARVFAPDVGHASLAASTG
ncbi:MAG TPA: CDP-paratose 2-epimerase [Verrucomicrobiales bacterium]|nr:CDP-paratose 2-epimerase [Verrucomicrobiales bacterium]